MIAAPSGLPVAAQAPRASAAPGSGRAGPASPAPARAPLPPPGFLDACLKLIEQGKTEDARQLLSPVVAQHPDWARAQLVLAMTYHRENRYQQARPLFERALSLEPENQGARFYYGWCLYYLGELDHARQEMETFLAAKPEHADAIFALGLIAFDRDDLEAARGHLLHAIELSRDGKDRAVEAKSRARLSDVLVREDRLAEAKAELVRSIELNPDNYEAYYKLSRVLERLGDAEGAAAMREKHREVRERRRPGSGGPPPGAGS